MLDFDTPSDFVRAYPMSREWLTLLIRRVDAVASVYRLASSLSPGSDGRRSRVEFHRKGCFDATITLHDGRDFGVVRQGLALRRRSLHDRLRALAHYDHSRRPDVVLILVPSVWERRLTGRFCERVYLTDFFIAVESRTVLERRDRRAEDEPPSPHRRSGSELHFLNLSTWCWMRQPSASVPRRSGRWTSSPTTR